MRVGVRSSRGVDEFRTLCSSSIDNKNSSITTRSQMSDPGPPVGSEAPTSKEPNSKSQSRRRKPRPKPAAGEAPTGQGVETSPLATTSEANGHDKPRQSNPNGQRSSHRGRNRTSRPQQPRVGVDGTNSPQPPDSSTSTSTPNASAGPSSSLRPPNRRPRPDSSQQQQQQQQQNRSGQRGRGGRPRGGGGGGGGGQVAREEGPDSDDLLTKLVRGLTQGTYECYIVSSFGRVDLL